MYRDNFLSEIGHNCGTHCMHKNRNNSSKIFKLYEITNVLTTTEEMVEYAYSTVKQVRKNIEAVKVEFDTFLRRDKSKKILGSPTRLTYRQKILQI